ncbi:hypothetical protein GCM10010433_55790 [Streptomyces pulveraceus]|uniref:Uncharacterized protein n=1 Tax=Streptomyces pulveraceus TaxID=68258 RepID=A0ABW1GPY2_9ACTN
MALVEIGHSGQGGEPEACYDGIRLTHRLIDDVVAGLHAKGYTGTPSDIGYDVHAGFPVWSTRVPEAREVDQTAGEDDPGPCLQTAVCRAASGRTTAV